jgi:hypothetical protein
VERATHESRKNLVVVICMSNATSGLPQLAVAPSLTGKLGVKFELLRCITRNEALRYASLTKVDRHIRFVLTLVVMTIGRHLSEIWDDMMWAYAPQTVDWLLGPC